MKDLERQVGEILNKLIDVVDKAGTGIAILRANKEAETKLIDLMGDWTEIRNRLKFFFMQTDGTYKFPNNPGGDLLKMVHKQLNNQVSKDGES